MKNRIFKKMLVVTTVIMLLITSIPFNLIVSADGGSGGGLEGGGGATEVNDVFITDTNIGLRFSLVTLKDGKRQVVKDKGGKYYTDVWANGSCTPSYDTVNSTSRYSPLPSKANIRKTYALAFNEAVNAYITDNSGVLENGGITLSLSSVFLDIPGTGLQVNGTSFYDWFMKEGATIKGEKWTRYKIIMNYLYNGCTSGLSGDNTFLVVEPVLNYGNPNGDYAITKPLYVVSWYGYITYNVDTAGLDPGRAFTARNRLQQIGSGFKLANTSYTSSEVKTAMQNVLGVSIPTQDYTCNGSNIEWFGYQPADSSSYAYNNMHKTVGVGMQAFWLKGTIKSGEPIDSYDIITKPNKPAPCEPPDKDKKNRRRKNNSQVIC